MQKTLICEIPYYRPMVLYRTYIYILLVLLQFGAYAVEKDIRFRRIEAETGFPSKNIERILEDSAGYLWFGTFDGLIRYDGSKYTYYKNQKGDSTSLGSRSVFALRMDSKNRIWAGGYNGLSLYQPDCDCFKVYRPTDHENMSIRGIAIDSLDNIWLGTEGGLFLFDDSAGLFHKILPDSIVYAMEVFDSTLYIATVKKGLTLFDVNEKKIIKRINHQHYDNFRPENKTVLDIDKDEFGNIWFVTGEGGLFKYNPKSNRLTVHPIRLEVGLIHPTFYSVSTSLPHKILIGTQNYGFIVYDPSSRTSVRYMPEEKSEYSICSKTIRSIMKTKNGTVWLGSHLGSVCYFHESDAGVRYYYVDKTDKTGLGYNVISGFSEDKEGRIWLSTDGGGINILDKNTGTFVKITTDQGLKTNSLTDITFDVRKYMWVGLWQGGVMRIDTQTLKPELVYFDTVNQSMHRSPNCVKGLFLDSRQRLFVFPLFSNLVILEDEGKTKYTSASPGNYPSEIFEMEVLIDASEDSRGNVWLYGFDEFGVLKKNNVFLKFSHDPLNENSPSANDIYNIFTDSKDRAWISTPDGFDCYNPLTDTYERVSDMYDFPRKVYSVLEDENGYLWVTTSDGFGRFHPDTMQIVFYDKNIGIIGDDFISRSCFKDSKGEMFFGSTNGFIRFHPDSVSINSAPPAVNITDFYLFNERVRVSDSSGLLKKPISVIDTLVLRHHQNIIGFKFAATDYVSPSKNQYAYRMTGFNDKWNYVGNKNDATYTNLNPGEYVFEIKAANNEGVWSKNSKRLTVIVLPPWWATWWFRLLSGFAVTGIVLLVFYLRVKQITRQNKLLEQKVGLRTAELKYANSELQWANSNLLSQKEEIESQRNEITTKNAYLIESKEEIEAQKNELESKNLELEELNNTKDKFFSIIAHDLKNPLGAMLGFADLLNNSFDRFSEEKKKKFIAVIASSSKSLLDLLENLLQWARSQSGAMPYKPRELSVNGLIQESILVLKHHADKKDIKLLFNETELFKVEADENMLNTIIRNLTSNAIKFTPKGGSISFAVTQSLKSVEITISDTGVGMTPKQIEQLFKIAKNKSTKGTDAETGTGLGLILCKEFIDMHNGHIWVESEIGKGSTFIIELPVFNT